MKINKSTIQELIIEGKTEKAIEMLLTLVGKYDMEIHNSSIMLASRYSSLKKDKMRGVISDSEAKLNENRINFALTQMLTDVKTSWEIGESPIQNENERSKKTILFLAANPQDTQPIRLDKEIREIEEGLRRSEKREVFKLVQKWAVRIPDLRRAFLDEKPNIIHFSGHGSSYGRIILEDEIGNSKEIPPKAIGNLFSLFKDDIECVLLNACYSESQAQEIAKYIPFVIGMNDAIPDRAAIEFSSAFYDAIGNGKDIEFAFRLAQISIELLDITGDDIPVLIMK
ncbi:CHAT domain-containing protein [Haliscomenobacter hydrossis]|uniref:Uncharacterized protein n=1 Tax=Haliscomenobacter hydrossis (strain ATCC 27775 / DSM 1100 / LMG 10767 / O) TaxID=760192 RepID=F4KSE2_HALH1|nr:CHAT domain-containing protein [Haliscomenobacter hydrossis]AEE53345.1 hypothetical protein Halhy_5520 [Haliscomenobacter hydrossis DSM 1100]